MEAYDMEPDVGNLSGRNVYMDVYVDLYMNVSG